MDAFARLRSAARPGLGGHYFHLLIVVVALSGLAGSAVTAAGQSTNDAVLEAQNALIPSPIRRGLLFGVDVPRGTLAEQYGRGLSATAWVALLETREPVNLRLELTYNELQQPGRVGTPTQLRTLGAGLGFMWLLHTPTKCLLPYTGLMGDVAVSKMYYGSQGAADVQAFPFARNPQYGLGVLVGAFIRGPHLSLIELNLPLNAEGRIQTVGNRLVTTFGVGLHF